MSTPKVRALPVPPPRGGVSSPAKPDLLRSAPSRQKTVVVPRPKPRNPVAPAAAVRHAGQHRRGASGERQRAQRALRRELTALHPPSAP